MSGVQITYIIIRVYFISFSFSSHLIIPRGWVTSICYYELVLLIWSVGYWIHSWIDWFGWVCLLVLLLFGYVWMHYYCGNKSYITIIQRFKATGCLSTGLVSVLCISHPSAPHHNLFLSFPHRLDLWTWMKP
jgi:hypothetical protein